MRRAWTLILTLAVTSWGAPTLGKSTSMQHQHASITVPMTAKMITGEGTLMFHPKGDQVEIHVVAKRLPPPDTYSLWLTQPKGGAASGTEIAAVATDGGQADLRVTVPLTELKKWRTVELLHQPSGSFTNLKEAHPALQATIPSLEAH